MSQRRRAQHAVDVAYCEDDEGNLCDYGDGDNDDDNNGKDNDNNNHDNTGCGVGGITPYGGCMV